MSAIFTCVGCGEECLNLSKVSTDICYDCDLKRQGIQPVKFEVKTIVVRKFDECEVLEPLKLPLIRELP